MLLFFSIETKTIEISLAGIIFISLFVLVALAYCYVHFRYSVARKCFLRFKKENDELRGEVDRLARELKKAEDALDQKNMMLFNTFSGIKTPMNAIFGFAELLSDRTTSVGERSGYAEMILRNANNLLAVINDIVDIVKIEKGQLVLEPKSLKLNRFIDDMERFARGELKNQGKQQIRISTVKFLGDKSSCFLVDPLRIRRIMVNLISNAVKFTKEGFIEFGYKLLENEILLFFVSDSGIGIERSYQKSIFDEFTQVTSLESKVRTGSGLGLVVSKNLVELMGGKMWVESVKGEGATFYFTIPGEPCVREAKPEHDEPEEFGQDCWADHTILIVDDYRDIYFYFSETLVNTGIRFFYADSGQKAIDLCREHPEIELVLMDIQMPGMTGIEATQSIRQFRKDLPVIAQTAYAQGGDIDMFLDAGFNDMIMKPIEKDLLLKKIAKYLG